MTLKPVYVKRNLAAIAERWDARAAAWDRNLRDPSCHLNEDEAYARFLTDVNEILAHRKVFCQANGVIDAGCGTGLVLAEVMSSFAWGIGVDISAGMIRAARSKKLQRVKFIIGDGFHLDAICPKAGVVLSRGVLLSHYGARLGVSLLRSARRALVPGGFIIFDFLNVFGRRHSAHSAKEKHWLTAAQARELGRQAGFSKVNLIGESNQRVRLMLAQT